MQHTNPLGLPNDQYQKVVEQLTQPWSTWPHELKNRLKKESDRLWVIIQMQIAGRNINFTIVSHWEAGNLVAQRMGYIPIITIGNQSEGSSELELLKIFKGYKEKINESLDKIEINYFFLTTNAARVELSMIIKIGVEKITPWIESQKRNQFKDDKSIFAAQNIVTESKQVLQALGKLKEVTITEQKKRENRKYIENTILGIIKLLEKIETGIDLIVKK